MKKLVLTAVAAAMCVTAPMPAAADNHAAPELAEVDWYRIMMIKWKPGMAGRAHEMIDQFRKVDEALGLSGGVDIHMSTGEWDSIVALPMRQGIAAMGWKENPEGKKWDDELERQLGGKEKVEAMWKEFDSLIARQQRHIGHIDRD